MLFRSSSPRPLLTLSADELSLLRHQFYHSAERPILHPRRLPTRSSSLPLLPRLTFLSLCIPRFFSPLASAIVLPSTTTPIFRHTYTVLPPHQYHLSSLLSLEPRSRERIKSNRPRVSHNSQELPVSSATPPKSPIPPLRDRVSPESERKESEIGRAHV